MPRLHKSSWVVAALTLVVCVLLIVPGQPVDDWVELNPRFVHGWPAQFLYRETNDHPLTSPGVGTGTTIFGTTVSIETPYEPSWYWWECWQVWHSSESEWQPLHLIIDLIVALAIISLATALWEFRRRRRNNLLQLRLTDLFVATTLVAVALSWIVSHYQGYAAERQVASLFDSWEKSQAPVWLQHLVGRTNLPSFFMRVNEIHIVEDHPHDNLQTEKLVSHLSRLRYLQYVVIFGSDKESAGKLAAAIRAKLPHCEGVAPEKPTFLTNRTE